VQRLAQRVGGALELIADNTRAENADARQHGELRGNTGGRLRRLQVIGADALRRQSPERGQCAIAHQAIAEIGARAGECNQDCARPAALPLPPGSASSSSSAAAQAQASAGVAARVLRTESPLSRLPWPRQR